ncbi:MAG TPA: hypothetical protein PKM50_08100 [Methanoregula sp.]|nr:hypothetical protein [Methanoregula sp.]
MSLQAKGKIVVAGKAGTRYISIPAKIASDSAFPFEDNEEVLITNHPDKKCLVITKIE